MAILPLKLTNGDGDTVTSSENQNGSCRGSSSRNNTSWLTDCGVLAQLVERLNGIEEVRGSNPLGSRIPTQSGCLDPPGDENFSSTALRDSVSFRRSLTRIALAASRG